jgi:hypothetical protein
MKEIDKIAFIEIQQGKILSTKSKGKPNIISLEKTEKATTLIREIAEELSVTIIPNTAEYIGTFSAQSDGEKEGINVIMTCYKAKYSGTLKANSEIDELKWLNHKDLDIISEVDKRYSPFLMKGELK